MTRKLMTTILASVATTSLGQVANATIILDGGVHNLLPNTAGQAVQIFASTDASDTLSGMNIQAALGDGPILNHRDSNSVGALLGMP